MTLEETPLDGPVEDALEHYRTASEEAQSAFDAYQDKSAASEAAWDKLVNLVRARHLLATGESITPSEAHEIISAALNPSEPEEGEPEPEDEEPEPVNEEPEPEEGEEPEPEPEPEEGEEPEPEPEEGEEPEPEPEEGEEPEPEPEEGEEP